MNRDQKLQAGPSEEQLVAYEKAEQARKQRTFTKREEELIERCADLVETARRIKANETDCGEVLWSSDVLLVQVAAADVLDVLEREHQPAKQTPIAL